MSAKRERIRAEIMASAPWSHDEAGFVYDSDKRLVCSAMNEGMAAEVARLPVLLALERSGGVPADGSGVDS